MFTARQGRKTGATDAHAIALAATRMTGLRPVLAGQQVAVLRVLADRRRALGEDHTRMICQLHQLRMDLIPGGAKKDLSAAQARVLLAGVRPRDPAGQARRRAAAELIADLERIYQRKKTADKELSADTRRLRTGPAGHPGTAPDSSAAGSHPDAGSSDKSLPGPATSDPTPIPPDHPATSTPRRTAAAVKRAGLDGGQDRRTLTRRE